MFDKLIRRNPRPGDAKDGPAPGAADGGESATFSLSADVPRPPERRADERYLALLPPARLIAPGWQDLCRIRNISAGGLMAEIASSRPAGDPVIVEINSHQRIPGTVLWTRETSIGVKFDKDADLREILAGRSPRAGYRARASRLEVACEATLGLGGRYWRVPVRDISLGGMKVDLDGRELLDARVSILVDNFRPLSGAVRWTDGDCTGLAFAQPLPFDELATWLGRRIEAATLKGAPKR